MITVKIVPGCKVSPLVWSIFFGHNADLTSGRDCNKKREFPLPTFSDGRWKEATYIWPPQIWFPEPQIWSQLDNFEKSPLICLLNLVSGTLLSYSRDLGSRSIDLHFKCIRQKHKKPRTLSRWRLKFELPTDREKFVLSATRRLFLLPSIIEPLLTCLFSRTSPTTYEVGAFSENLSLPDYASVKMFWVLVACLWIQDNWHD